MGTTPARVVTGVILAAGAYLASALMSWSAEPLSSGDSLLVRNGASVGFHVPASLAEPHGPAGVLIEFGGVNDTVDEYVRALRPVADRLDLVLLVPQLPWSEQPGKVSPAGLSPILGHLVDEVSKQFAMTDPWIVIGGVSAGGAPAHELAKKWGSKVDLFFLGSTGPFSDVSGPRVFHVVADKEIARLGPQGHRGVVLGQGRKDMFAIPGGKHSPQFRHVRAWLETELSAMRLEQAPKTLHLAEEKLAKGEMEAARAILRSTVLAGEILGEPAPAGDAFFEYTTKRRQDLSKKHAAAIGSLEAAKAKMSAPPPAALAP